MIIDMNKLILSRNILFLALGFDLVVRIYYLSDMLSSRTEDSYSYGLGEIIRYFVIPYLFIFAGLFLTYVRFQKNYLKANWGLLVVALYIFITLAMEIFNMIRWQYFNWQFIAFYLVPSIAIFYAIYLILSEVKKEDSDKKKKYQPSEELSEKEFLPTLILCFFVGMLGIHRFFVGKVGTGILMIVTLGGLGIWVLVDFIMICIGSFKDIDGRIIKYQRAVIAPSSSETGIAEELEKFAELKEKGVISEEEFNKKKEELLK